MSRPTAAAASSLPSRPTLLRGGGDQVDVEYASDHWHADRLGVPARRGRNTARFDTITQPWLRDPVKRWSRVRLATGCAFATISAGGVSLGRFSAFLTERHPAVDDETAITRPVLEDYLSWLVTKSYSASTRALSLSMLRVFFDACHRHGWLPGLSAGAVIYVEELPYHHDQVARFIPEFVMAQLETDAALDRLPNPTARNLIVTLIETGLRIGDACTLEFSPMLDDSVGWPCLRFDSTKVRAEQLIPLSAKPPMRSAPNRITTGEYGPREPRGCSPLPSTTPTVPSPTPPPRSADSCAGGRPSSTCATKPASRSASPPTASVTPSGPGSSTLACPNTSSRSSSAMPAPT